MIQSFLQEFIGISSWILLLIPLVLLVRLLFRRSRWSIIRMSFVAITGVSIVSLWLSFFESVAGIEPMSLSGKLGGKLAEWLSALTGRTSASFLVSTMLLFVWSIFAILDAIITTSRFFINKPYACKENKEKKSNASAKPKQPIAQTSVKAVAPSLQKKPSVPDEVPEFKTPAIGLLKDRSSEKHEVTKAEVDRNVSVISETLSDHHVEVSNIEAVAGPTVTLYKVFPAKGVKVSAICRLAPDVSVALKTDSVRTSILKDCVGFEVSNQVRSVVSIRELVSSAEFRGSHAELPVAIGRKVTGEVKVFDLVDAPHLLVAGATKQGKSVGLNVMVASLLYAKRPSELKFVFIDPKKTEFGGYARLKDHYLAIVKDPDASSDEMTRAIVKDPIGAERTLRSLCQEMEDRYTLLEKAGTPNLVEYREKWNAHKLNPNNGHHYLPYIVAIIDEYAQLILGTGGPDAKANARSIISSIVSLAAMGRACGIHLVIATQSPRHEVVSGLIKANFPMSIAFKTKTVADSMVILDEGGAENLIGKGDMLLSADATTERIQCGYISSSELTALTSAIEAQKGYKKSPTEPYYLPEVQDVEVNDAGQVDMKKLDDRFEEAARMVVSTQRASTSYLQTTLEMGFARSARVMSQLEAAGIVGPQKGSKQRDVLIGSQVELETILKSLE